MLANSSSSNDSLPPSSISSNSYVGCILSSSNLFSIIAFHITHIVLFLPLCLRILYHCLQQYLKTCSTSVKTTSHLDYFACHMVLVDLIGVSGYTVSCCGIYLRVSNLLLTGFFLFKFAWFGETFFLILTCLDLYLAVVHPITYLGLKNGEGIRIRIITTVCFWIACFAVIALAVEGVFIIIDLSFLIISLIITSFFSLSVLSVLIRPSPGEQGGAKERIERSKLRAFITITGILGVLVLRFSGGLVWSVHEALGGEGLCLIISYTFWLNLPSSLTLPLLFLHRTGKFACCRKNTQ